MIIIDAGHGGFDPGGGSNVYFKEKDLTKKYLIINMKDLLNLAYLLLKLELMMKH